MRNVDVIIPVYNGLEETRRCIETALATVDSAWARLVVINDASPDPHITTLLRNYAADNPQLVLLENEHNLGFVATANRGLRYDSNNDAVLLNSDVEVANDWLFRLREAAYHHQRVASLTPFANNATICSFPDFCKDNNLLFDLDVAQLDSHFATHFSVEDVFSIPTGIGCCMYLRRDCLDDIGYFDEDTFGRGYGEENDWCQRAEQAGWRNLHLGNCFVYHKGGVSFAQEQTPRVARAMELLDQRYPHYHATIGSFVVQDPAREVRIPVLLGLFAAQHRPKVLFISHKLGGGVQEHLNELAKLYAADALFLQLVPEQDGQSVTLGIFDQGRRLRDGLYFDVDSEFDKLVALLRELGVGHVHFHHTLGLHPRIWAVAGALDCDYDLTIHDYYLVNGNPTLTDAEARFVAESSPEFDQRCAGHYPLPDGISAQQWRLNQRPLVSRARRVIFPSTDCARRFQRYFTVAQPVICWHPDYLAAQPYPQPQWHHDNSRPLRILVVGAISREKGADILEEVAAALAGSPVEMHLLGYAYRALGKGIITHGPYDSAQAKDLIKTIAPDVVWFPALWPETYSYTLSLALRLGLPVVVPDIGAFVERVAGRVLSVVCPWDRSVREWQLFWQDVAAHGMDQKPGLAAVDTTDEMHDFYADEYLRGVAVISGVVSATVMAGLRENFRGAGHELTSSERWLGRIWRFSRRPLVARLVALVPFGLQQAIKRRFSARPMHDIVR
ncbi:glycosyltransferase [Kineobactrum sediminis]|nr:glycosyltransferase [Kineobactrum sediminis]